MFEKQEKIALKEYNKKQAGTKVACKHFDNRYILNTPKVKLSARLQNLFSENNDSNKIK